MISPMAMLCVVECMRWCDSQRASTCPHASPHLYLLSRLAMSVWAQWWAFLHPRGICRGHTCTRLSLGHVRLVPSYVRLVPSTVPAMSDWYPALSQLCQTGSWLCQTGTQHCPSYISLVPGIPSSPKPHMICSLWIPSNPNLTPALYLREQFNLFSQWCDALYNHFFYCVCILIVLR